MPCDPAKTGRSGDRYPVPRTIINLVRFAGGDKRNSLVDGVRVRVGASPDLLVVLVVQDHALAHARSAYRGHGVRPGTCTGERLPHALPHQQPVRCRVEHL